MKVLEDKDCFVLVGSAVDLFKSRSWVLGLGRVRAYKGYEPASQVPGDAASSRAATDLLNDFNCSPLCHGGYDYEWEARTKIDLELLSKLHDLMPMGSRTALGKGSTP